MKVRYIVRFMLFFGVYFSVQIAKAQCELTTEGTEFWVGFMPQFGSNENLRLYATSRFTTTGEVYSQGGTILETTINITPNAEQIIELITPDDFISPIAQTPAQKGIFVTTDQPISLFALNQKPASADAALILPLKTLGKEYYIMTFRDGTEINSIFQLPALFQIVATEDNTSVTIIPSKDTNLGNLADVPINIVLQRGDAYLVASKRDAGEDSDLTGSYVESNKPIAVFAGNQVCRIAGLSGDHLYEQIPSIDKWGQEFVTIPSVQGNPLVLRSYDYFRLLAKEDATIIEITGEGTITLNRGEFYTFNTENNNIPRVINSNKPIMVGQFAIAQQNGEVSGDPYFIVLSPTSQTIKEVNVSALNVTPGQNYYFIDIITKTSNTSNIVLDGTNPTFATIAGSDMSYSRSAVDIGVHNINNTLPTNFGFIAYIYGYGAVESYGYLAGSSLNTLVSIENEPNFCGNVIVSRTLKGSDDFIRYEWRKLPTTSILSTNQSFTVNESGEYQLTVESIEGCILTKTIELVFDATPPFVAEITYEGNSKEELLFCNDAGVQTINVLHPTHTAATTYKWRVQGNPTVIGTDAELSVNNFSATTVYEVEVINSCSLFDEIVVTFEPVLDIEITFEGNESTNLNFCDSQGEQTLTATTNSTLNLDYKWFEDGVIINGETENTLVVDNSPSTKNYSVEVTRLDFDLDCPQTDEVIVVFTPTPVAKITLENQDISTQNLVYCDAEGTKLLNGQDPSHHNQIQYQWYQTNTVLDPLGTSFATTPSVLTTHFSSTKVYTLVVTDASNPTACGDTTFVTIQFKPLPTATIHYDNQVADTILRFCDNDNRQLLYVDSTANPASTSYQWFEQETNTLLSTFGALWVDNFSDTTVYRVEAELNGCITRDTIRVVFFPSAVILQGNELAPDTLIFCDAEGSQNLEAGYNSTTGQVTYSWKDITNPSAIQEVGTDRILSVANFSDTTRYEITIVDAINGILNSCKVKDTVTVIFFGNSAAQIKKVGENHFPDSLILCASEGGINLTTGLPAHLLPTTTFQWSELAAPTTSIGTNPTFSIDEFRPHQTITKKYKVTISNSIFNCQANDTITVVFLPPLGVVLTGSKDICDGNQTPITFRLSGSFPLKLTYREIPTVGIPVVREVYVGTPTTPSPFDYVVQSRGGIFEVLALRDTICNLSPLPTTITAEVTVTPKPEVLISSLDTVICINETTKFVADGATSYVFYKNGLPMPAGAVTNEYAPPIGTFQNGDRIWVIGETNGCPDTSRIMTVIVNPLPVVNLGVDRYKCKTDTALIIAPRGNFIYDWKKISPTGTIISVGNGNDTLFVLDTGTYFIRLENALTGCSSVSNRVKVFNFNDEVVVDLGEDKTVCDPSDLPYRLIGSDLSHLNGTTYKWYVAGTNTVIGRNSVLDVRAENTYSVVVEDPRGCQISDTIRINFAPTPDFVITGHENPNCSTFDTLRIERTNVRGMSINWFGNGIVSLSDSNKVAIVNVSGMYTATVTDTSTPANCSYTQSVEVFVRPTIDLGVSTTSDTLRLCEGDSLVLNAFRPEHNNNFTYQWRVIESNRVVSTNSKIAINYEMVDNYVANRFEIKVTDPNRVGGGSCSILDTIIVRFDRKSGVQIEEDFIKTLCLGQTQTLTALGADSYQWSNGATTQSIEITPTEAGFYTYIVKGIFRTPNLCGASADTVKFRVVPVPEIAIPETLVICENDSVEVNAFLPSHEPRYVYEWKNENTGEIIDSTSMYVFKQDSSNINYEPQTYRVGVYDTLGGGRCGAESLITVTFNRSATTEITASDTLVCVGEEITLRATGATNFRWNTGETTQEITISSDSAGIFRYTVVGSYGDGTNQNVCDSTGTSILVQFKDVPKITLNKPDTISICTGDLVEFIAKGGFTYTWSHSPAASGDTVVVYPTDTTTYIVTGFDTLGCSSTDTTVVLVQPQIDLGQDQQLCEGDTAIIGAPRPFGATYLWNTGQTSDSIRVRKSGLYYVEVSINECSYTDSVRINFIEPPVLSAKDTILCFEDENSNQILHQIGVEIENYDSTARYRYQWFDENEDLVGQDSLLSVEFGGVYLARVTVQYANSCTAITSLEVEASCDPQIFIPSAFTPNQDRLNEEWEIFGRFYSNLRIKVLDRWGMEVYSILQKRSDDPIAFWDGTHKGKKVPSGVYYYEVTYTSPTDRSKTIKQTGTVTVIY